jgi:CMP/dCMP kinase
MALRLGDRQVPSYTNANHGFSFVIIAVDGPSASGKGTLARLLAKHFGLSHLDTGALYRAVGLGVLRNGGNPADPLMAEQAARALDLSLLSDPELRAETTGGAASQVAAHPGVRAALLEFQRTFARRPGGAVLDGRDIGTVICPAATAKLFVTASSEARAKRRYAELAAQGRPRPLAEVQADIEARDARDSGRDAAPLAMAADALLLDTTSLDIDAALAEAVRLIETKLGSRWNVDGEAS